jgi:hypothetical protein
MPENTEGGSKEFAAFVKSTRSVEELTSGKHVTVRGTVHRSGDAAFVLALGGQLVELDASSVERFKVVGSGLHPEVELSINAEALKAGKVVSPKPVFLDGPHTLFTPDQKSLVKDVHTDPISDHKPVFKDLHTDPLADQTLFVLDHKTVHKDPIMDPVGKVPFDPSNTGDESLAEGIGGIGGPVFNPASQQAVAGMTPFVMATPHHAPSAMVDLQMAAAQGRANPQLKPAQFDTVKEVTLDNTLKELIADTHKESVADTIKETIADTHKESVADTLKESVADTLKESVADTLKESVADTRKEIIETMVEGGGSIQEGGGFPGGFPGGFGL